MKRILIVLAFALIGFQGSAQAQAYPPYYGAYPYPYPSPYPYYGYPYVTCFAQGLANGAYFYGVSYNVYAANQLALNACLSTGQYCQLTGCR